MNRSYEIVSQQILDMMAEGDVPWSKPWIVEGLIGQCNGTSKRAYTGLNALVLSMRADRLEVKSPYWLTAKKGFEMGLQLPKGEKGTVVLGWFKRQAKNEAGELEDTDGLFCRGYRLFNFEQFVVPDGVVLPKHFTEKREVRESKFPLIDRAEALVKATGANVSYDSNAAYYVPLRDKVFMPNVANFVGIEEYYSTLFHELTHWTGHESRLKRFKSADCPAFRSDKYSAEELTAELGAAFICSRLDISSESALRNSAAYIKGWMKFIKTDPKAFVFACQRAQKATDLIFGMEAESVSV